MSLEKRSQRWMEGAIEHPLRWPLLRATSLVWLWTGVWLVAAALSGNPTAFQVGPVIGVILLGVGHASKRFASKDATEWALARGVWTRKDLARWTVLEIVVRGLNVLAAVLVARWLFLNHVIPIDPELALRTHRPDRPYDALGSAFTAVYAGVCATWTTLVVLTLIVQVRGCTWLPLRIASMRSRPGFDRRALTDFGVSTLIFVLLAAPAGLISFVTEREWPVAIYGAALLIPLYACVAGQEAVEPIRPDSASGARWRVSLPSHSFSPRTALLWRAVRADTKAFAFLAIVSSAVLGILIPAGPRDHLVLYSVATVLLFVSVIGICFAPGRTFFRWKSHGPTAEYLASLGVEYRTLRRLELSSGWIALAVIASSALVFVGVYLANGGSESLSIGPNGFLVLWWGLLLAVLIAVITCNHELLWRARRVHRWVHSILFFGIGVPSLTVLYFQHREAHGNASLEIAGKGLFGGALLALWILIALALWLRAWFRSKNEQTLREIEFGRPD